VHRPRRPAGRFSHRGAFGAHGLDLRTLAVEAGFLANAAAGRTGRRTSSPPQFAQTNPSLSLAQRRQKVHSNEQM